MARMITWASGAPTATLGTSDPSGRRCTRRAFVAPVTGVATASAAVPAGATLIHRTRICPAARPATLPTSTARTNSASCRANTLPGFTAGGALEPDDQVGHSATGFSVRRSSDRSPRRARPPQGADRPRPEVLGPERGVARVRHGVVPRVY